LKRFTGRVIAYKKGKLFIVSFPMELTFRVMVVVLRLLTLRAHKEGERNKKDE